MGSDRFYVLDSKLREDINFLVQNNSYMVAQSDVLIFLKRLLSNNYKVLGIEGFIFDGNYTPDMNSIIDFNDAGLDRDAMIRAATEIIKDSRSNFFEFTIE